MRILANYGYKNNGDTYSVTFETMGDVPKDKADSSVDELFSLAKAAIQRQINPDADPFEFPPKDMKGIIIPEPKKTVTTNGNGKTNGHAPEKPPLKDPEAPATPKQKSLIIRLAKERGKFVNGLNNFTMQEASEKIDDLMAVMV